MAGKLLKTSRGGEGGGGGNIWGPEETTQNAIVLFNYNVGWFESYDSSEIVIYSLAVYDGKLYAGSGNGGKIYVYDGENWSESYDSNESYIRSLAVYGGKLYAGTGPGGKIYVYDGENWSESYDSNETQFISLVVYGNKLYAGTTDGYDGRVYVYDGVDWSLNHTFDEGVVYSLAVYSGKLYAGVGGTGKIYVYNGISWSESYDSDDINIFSLAVYDGKLYAGSGNGGKIYVYDGVDWSLSYDSSEGNIESLVVYNEKLYAGTGVNGKVFVYDGVDWSEDYDSSEHTIYSLAVYNNKLYAGTSGNGKIYYFNNVSNKLIKDSTRLIEDALTNGSNLPDGHAIKTYGDANWGGAGSGDVVGPASAVDNAIPLFDGTTGKLIKDSTRLIEDALTNGSNLPDGHAIKTYGDANWGGGGPGGDTIKDIGWSATPYNLTISNGMHFNGYAIPLFLNGWNLTDFVCSVYNLNGATGSSTNINIKRIRGAGSVSMLSTPVTISYNQYSAHDGIINTGYDDLQTGDILFPMVVQLTSGYPQKGLFCTATFEAP